MITISDRVVGLSINQETSTKFLCVIIITRNSSGDEIANVNFLYDDIVHALKIQQTLA